MMKSTFPFNSIYLMSSDYVSFEVRGFFFKLENENQDKTIHFLVSARENRTV